MEIIEIKPQGFCGGVRQAILKVRALTEEKPETPITILGALVHNEYISKALEARGVKTVEAGGKSRLEMLEDVKEGCVVFTAHGVEDKLYEKARKKGLEVVDASCPFVLKTKELVKQKATEGCHILYIGKKGHPEAEAVCSSASPITLVESRSDIPEGIEKPVFVTNQTTMSILDLKDLFEAIKEKYPEAIVHDEICNATRVRQQALMDLKNQDFDALVVVGDPSSNNTRQLEAIGRLAGIPYVVRVENAMDLDLEQFRPDFKVAVTSGASTPKALEKQVVQALQEMKLPKSIDLDTMLEV